MNKVIALVCLGLAIVVSAPAYAGEQQEKMKGCNKEAKENGLKGDDRKAFMSKCLKKDYKLKAKAADTAGEKGDVSSGKSEDMPEADTDTPAKKKAE
ncbi:MAG: PsiF family protein [Gallionella sp.]